MRTSMRRTILQSGILAVLLTATSTIASAHIPLCVTWYTVHPSRGLAYSVWASDASGTTTYLFQIGTPNTTAAAKFAAIMHAYGAPLSVGKHEFTKKAPVITFAWDQKTAMDAQGSNGDHLILAAITDLADADRACPIAPHETAE